MNLGLGMVGTILLTSFFVGLAAAQGPGAETYKARCAICHGADGLAATAMGKSLKIFSFKDPAMLKAGDARFVLTTRNGEGKMPAYAGKLTDVQIRDVIAYIRTLQK